LASILVAVSKTPYGGITMGFLQGLAYKLVGNVYLLKDGNETGECWTLWTDDVLRHDGVLFESKIRIRKDVAKINSIPYDRAVDRWGDARLQALSSVMSKEEMALIVGMFALPIIGVPLYMARKKALTEKSDALRREMEEPENPKTMQWLTMQLCDGTHFLAVAEAEIAANLLRTVNVRSEAYSGRDGPSAG